MGRIPHDYVERCYAGWLGKIIGVRLGAPIEGWTYAKIQEKYGELWDYPMDYKDFAADDDTNGPMFFLRALHDYGVHATAEQMGKTWLNYAPYEHGFYWWGGYGRSTEHTAYTNLRSGIPAPLSGSIAQNGATVAEQIGGQIFIDTWGLVNPAAPERAAEYAQKAASVSHDGNGMYGGMFVAACISAAFVENDIEKVIQIGLNQIPADCEYRRMADDIECFYRAHPDSWRDCFHHIHANWGYDRYPGNCHIIPNSAVMLLSMYYGGGDFSKTICICNMCGWDTDCNVGNVGAIMGTLVGLDSIESKWIDPVHDFLASSSVIGSLNIMDAPECVMTIARLAYKIANEPFPDRYVKQIEGSSCKYHFELPRSTHSFRLGDGCEGSLENTDHAAHSGERSLLVKAKSESKLDLYLKTYYAPGDFTDSRYDPDFSPLIYPGQTVVAHLMLAGPTDGLSGRLYASDRSGHDLAIGEPVSLTTDNWAHLALKLDCPKDSLIKQIGIRIEGEAVKSGVSVYVDDVDFTGAAGYVLDFSKEQMELWHNHRRNVAQLTYLRGIWELENKVLACSGTSHCEAYTGYYFWEDYAASTTLIPKLGDTYRFLFRVQGAIRSYALCLKPNGIALEKNNNGYIALATQPFALSMDQPIRLSVQAVGNKITAVANGVTLTYTDNDSPYLYGQIGWGLENGRMHVINAAVHPV